MQTQLIHLEDGAEILIEPLNEPGRRWRMTMRLPNGAEQELESVEEGLDANGRPIVRWRLPLRISDAGGREWMPSSNRTA